MRQTEIFDLNAGMKAKQEGMDLAADNREYVLGLARRLLVAAARSHPDLECTADDAQRGLIAHGYSPEDLGNAAGSLFRGKEWEDTGRRMKSERVTNHGHQNRIWRFVGA